MSNNLTDDPANLARYVQAAVEATSEEEGQQSEYAVREWVNHLREAHSDLIAKGDTGCTGAHMAGSCALIARHTESRLEAAAVAYAVTMSVCRAIMEDNAVLVFTAESDSHGEPGTANRKPL